jgi:hypothetical protein
MTGVAARVSLSRTKATIDMTLPTVTEIPLPLEPVARDPFIDDERMTEARDAEGHVDVASRAPGRETRPR